MVQIPFSIFKAGLIGLTKAMAVDESKYEVRVNGYVHLYLLNITVFLKVVT